MVAAVEDENGRPVEIRIGERALACVAPGPAGGNVFSRARETLPGGGAVAGAGAAKEVFVFVGGAHAATIELQETWREGMDAALQELAELNVGVEILTGDSSTPDARLAGVTVLAGLTPLEKHERVRRQVAAGRCVTFVGDGVNDAAAMGAAQASVAMKTGAELTHAAAMAVFAGEDLRFLPRAIRVARGARRSIRTNLVFAAGYNSAGMALAAAGILHPVVAALLMLGSSAFVSVNALRNR